VWSWRRHGRLALAQLRVQPWVALAWLPALLLAVPFGWVCAYAQSATVIGEAEKLHGEAAAQAKLWPAQNHLALLMLALVAICAWVNLAAAFYLVPWFANRMLGVENLFGFSGWWAFNTTFLASVTTLTWLAIDPLVKAFFTLRVFHGRARRTGDDVRLEFQLARRKTPGLAAASSLVLVLALVGSAPLPRLAAADAPPTPSARTAPVQPAPLDRAIDEVLAGRDFQWRLRPPAAETKATDGPTRQFFRAAAEWLRGVGQSVGKFFRSIRDWWERHFGGSKPAVETKPAAASGLASGVLQLVLYAFLALAVGLIGWVLWMMWRQSRALVAPVLAARAVATAAPDLRDENLQAAQLPTDGWLALAREQIARGEWRLALRALYLATLARLAGEGLLTLAKFKTNLDYERELRRRALSRTELVARFATRRRRFEDAWYGRAQPDEAEVRAWLAESERAAAP
jgi:hypothetical protein